MLYHTSAKSNARVSNLKRCKKLRRLDRAVRAAIIETLESRRLLSTAVWTGGAGDSLWSSAGNWQAGVVPAANDSVDFPSHAGATQYVDLAADQTVSDVTFEGDYVLRSSSNTLTIDGNVTAGGSNDQFFINVALGHNTTITVAGADAGFQSISDGGHGLGLIKAGSGTLSITGNSNTYTGTTEVAAGALYVGAQLASPIVVDSGATFEGQASARRVTSHGGSVVLGNTAGAEGFTTVSSGFSLDAHSTLTEELVANFNTINAGVINANGGPINLGGATLQVTFNDMMGGNSPTIGDVYTLINNHTGTVVNGTFAGLPEGTPITVGGMDLQISYVGGHSHRDVTLTVIQPAAVWTGNSGNYSWDSAGNWQGGVVPLSGQSVEFPANSSNQYIDPGSGKTVGNMIFDGAYYFAPQSITINGNITVNNDILIQGGLNLTHDTNVTVAAGRQFSIYSINDGGQHFGISKGGGGDLYLDYNTGGGYTGPTEVVGGRLLSNLAFASGLTVDTGATYVSSGFAASTGGLVANGGTVQLGQFEYGSRLTVSGAVSFGAGSILREIIGTPFDSSNIDGKLIATGPSIDLTGSSLDVSAPQAPSLGDVFTLISNQTGHAVHGHFTGLPDGSQANINGTNYRVNYFAGVSHHDVTLTVVAAPDVWTGAGDGSSWTDANNWQNNAIPNPDDSVLFPNLNPGTTTQINLNGDATISDLKLDGSYYFNGGTLTLDGNITANQPRSGTFRMTLNHPTTVTVGASDDFAVQGTDDGGNGYGITKEGDGILYVNGSGQTFTGDSEVVQGMLESDSGFVGNVTVDAGATLSGGGSVGAITDNGGTISLTNGGYTATLSSSGNVSLGNGSVLSEVISDDPMMGENTGALNVSGSSIDLTGSTFDVSLLQGYQPAIGDSFTLISNQTGNAVTGTFHDLPEGAVKTINGIVYKVSYVGGSSAQDVTLTVVPPAVWTGGGSDNLWSDAANWQNNVVPSTGADVTIHNPNSGNGSQLETINVDVPVTVGSLDLAGVGLTGDRITLGGDIDASYYSAIVDPITLTHDITIQSSQNLALALGGVIDDGGNAYGITISSGSAVAMLPMTLDNSGQVTPLSTPLTQTYLGPTIVTGNSKFLLHGSLASSLQFDGNSQVFAGGETASLNNQESNSASSISIGSNLVWAGAGPDTLISDHDATFSRGTAIAFDIGGTAIGDGTNAAASSDLDVLTGQIALNNATFSGNLVNGYTALDNDVITLISNHTGNAIDGTFNGLAEGAAVTIGQQHFTISYDGGASGQDVTLTAHVAPVVVTPPPTPTPTPTPITTTTPTIATVMPDMTTRSVRPTLSILGADTGTAGEAGLTYTWSVTHAPSGAKAIAFSDNGTNTAKTATARIRKAGTYVLQCIITNPDGNSVATTVMMVVKQSSTTLRLHPHGLTIRAGSTVQLGGVTLDQFAHPMRTAPTVTYAITQGNATIDATGLFTAGSSRGHVIIRITIDDMIGTLGATIV